MHVTRGWTAFLQETTPDHCLDDLPPSRGCDVAKRQRLLGQMYEVALMEEEYQAEGMGK